MTASGQFDVENKYDLVLIKDSEIQKATEPSQVATPVAFAATAASTPASPTSESSSTHDLLLEAGVQESSNHVQITVSK